MATDVLTTINFNSYVAGLPATNSLASADVFYVSQSGVAKKTTGAQIAALSPSGQPGQQNTAYFNVRNYGATGNGTTDDTAAINSAIVALNTAKVGVLYFPAGAYLVSSSLTTITGSGKIMGDGAGADPQVFSLPFTSTSMINYVPNNSSCFTVASSFLKFQDLVIQYVGTNSGLPLPVTGSAGITVTSSNVGQKVDYDSIGVGSFLINIDIQTGEYWTAHNLLCVDFGQYGMRIKNINNPDAGDWSLSDCTFVSRSSITGTTGIRIESSGGGKITNVKINGNPNIIATCIDVEGAGNTVDMMISNCSFEAFMNAGIKINGAWPAFIISGCQFSAWQSPPTIGAISVVNNPTTIILGCSFNGSQWTTTPALINLSGSTGISIGPNVVDSSITIPLHN